MTDLSNNSKGTNSHLEFVGLNSGLTFHEPVPVGADGRSDLGLKFDSLGLDPTSSSSQTSLTSFGDRFEDNDSPESSLNRQVNPLIFLKELLKDGTCQV